MLMLELGLPRRRFGDQSHQTMVDDSQSRQVRNQYSVVRKSEEHSIKVTKQDEDVI